MELTTTLNLPAELVLRAKQSYENPYLALEVEATFTGPGGETIVRPGFWDGGTTWRIRFTATATGSWNFQTRCSIPGERGLHDVSGSVDVHAATGAHPLRRHGLLQMSPGGRQVQHADGRLFFITGDTPWAIPFRATREETRHYAAVRAKQGFNTALLMVVQPDRDAEGPAERSAPEGYARAFTDLEEGQLDKLIPEYFQHLDDQIEILLEAGIVPVYSPVFQGFGWKGKEAMGEHISTEAYVRFVRYLLARYGADPAFWLVSADASGDGESVRAAGEFLEEWDAYSQPTGLHYNPYDRKPPPEWAIKYNRTHLFQHGNNANQAADWLDFQWAQTGHGGEHITYKVAEMFNNKPRKAVANGEPTYEGMGGGDKGLGWWQGHEAWLQITHGATMGVVYGAAALWQWKHSADEPGFPEWTDAPWSWKHALELEGARYVGHLGTLFKDLPFEGLVPMEGEPGLDTCHMSGVEGKLYVVYLPEGGDAVLPELASGLEAVWINPKTGERRSAGPVEGSRRFTAEDAEPSVLIAMTCGISTFL